MYPINLHEKHAYYAWRDRKLDNYSTEIGSLIQSIDNPIQVTDKEQKLLLQNCAKANLVIYKFENEPENIKVALAALAQQLGLINLDDNLCADEDKFSVLEDLGSERAAYIPYTNKALNWHTDGYYNDDEHHVRAFLMHCVCPAKRGGENSYLDPEIAYILLRDENPDYIEALMDPTVMTIPANQQAGMQIRPAQSGPVFSFDEITRSLHMRYTARQKNIVWKNNKIVKNALSYLHELLQGNPYLFSYRLKAGEGVICNNVLHNRTAYEDSLDKTKKRKFYRARYYNRINCNLENAQNVVNQ